MKISLAIVMLTAALATSQMSCQSGPTGGQAADSLAAGGTPELPAVDWRSKLATLSTLLGQSAPAQLQPLADLALQPALVVEAGQVEQAYALRDQLLEVEGFAQGLTDKAYELEQTELERLDQELGQLGLAGIYVEGMLVDLGKKLFLAQQLEQLCAKDFALCQRFWTAYHAGMGSEYPFADMSEHIRALKLAEQLRAEFPESDCQLDEAYDQMLSTFVDFHKQIDASGEVSWLHSGIYTDFWPNLSDLDNYQGLAEQLPESLPGRLVAQVLADPSVIRVDAEGTFARCHAVVVDQAADYMEAERKRMEYLRQGKAVAHVVVGQDGQGQEQALCVYRVYDAPDKAQATARAIVADFPQARVVALAPDGSILD